MGQYYDGSERNGRLETIASALETDYADGGEAGVTVPTAGLNAVLAQNVKITPINGELVKRQFVQRFMGGRPSVRVGQHELIEFEVELAGAGTPGTAPALGPLLRLSGLAETLITGLATIATSATAGAGATGTFSYTKTTAYAGTYARTVTLTCTTGGGSGVAAFTVSAPATPGDAAVNTPGVVMTDAAPLTLIQSAQVTPTVGTAFEVGDTYTIALTPARAVYTPVSEGFESAAIYYEKDGVLYKGFGGRGRASIKIAKKSFPVLMLKVPLLTLPVSAGNLSGADYSAWRDPFAVAPAHEPVFRLDGYDAVYHELTVDTGNDAKYTTACNAEGVRIGDRSATHNMIIDEPAITTKDFYVLSNPVGGVLPTVDLWARHGVDAGEIIDITARCQLDQVTPQSGGDGEPPQLAISGDLIPGRNTGNDEFSIAFG